MRIDSASIGMDSARLQTSSVKISQYVEIRSGSQMTTGSQLGQSFDGFLMDNQSKNASNSKEAKENDTDENISSKIGDETSAADAYESLSVPTKIKLYNISERDNTKTTFQKLREKMVLQIFELLFGKKKCKSEDDENQFLDAMDLTEMGRYELVTTTQYTSFYSTESECTSFSAKGLVKTDDGREINVNLNISMSSSFTQVYSESVSTLTYNCVDPLVINLSDAPPSLSDMKFFFDLDADGTAEEISRLDSKSGYLSLDLNEDGKINDGSELFGTKSGDGFRDLAKYDEDHNGWIDENDSIFEKLKIWTQDEDGNDVLYTLKDKDVGAIYLGSADTDFGLRSKVDYEANGFVRSTGIFLYENGNVGTVQHIDLVS